MKKSLFLLYFTAFILNILMVNAQGYYDKTYDFGDIDHPLAVVTDSLENVYVCGWYEDENNENERAFILKIDSNGQEVWRDSLSVPSKYFALCFTHTGDVALAGSRNNRCFLSLRSSQTGTQVWDYEEPGSEDYWFATVNEVLDNNIYQLHVVKTKNGPHIIWYYHFNPLNGNYLYEFTSLNNTVYGVTYTSSLMNSSQVWTAGDLNDYEGLIRNENYGPGISSYWTFASLHIAGVHRYSDDRGCSVHYFDWGGSDYHIQILTMKLDVSDIWGNSFKIGYDNFNVTGSDKYENGKFVITGTIENELALWFIDHDLTEMEDKTIPTQYSRTGIDVVALPSTDMILMGVDQPDTGNNATDVFLMKLDNNGLVSTPEHKHVEKITIYPNPVTNQLYLKSNGHNLNYDMAYIINSTGLTVKTITNVNRPVSVADLPEGLYGIVVYNNGKLLYCKKFIKK